MCNSFKFLRFALLYLFSFAKFVCRIHELQEDIIKLKLDLENSQECIKHLNTQVRKARFGIVCCVRRFTSNKFFLSRWRKETKRSSV